MPQRTAVCHAGAAQHPPAGCQDAPGSAGSEGHSGCQDAQGAQAAQVPSIPFLLPKRFLNQICLAAGAALQRPADDASQAQRVNFALQAKKGVTGSLRQEAKCAQTLTD